MHSAVGSRVAGQCAPIRLQVIEQCSNATAAPALHQTKAPQRQRQPRLARSRRPPPWPASSCRCLGDQTAAGLQKQAAQCGGRLVFSNAVAVWTLLGRCTRLSTPGSGWQGSRALLNALHLSPSPALNLSSSPLVGLVSAPRMKSSGRCSGRMTTCAAKGRGDAVLVMNVALKPSASHQAELRTRPHATPRQPPAKPSTSTRLMQRVLHCLQRADVVKGDVDLLRGDNLQREDETEMRRREDEGTAGQMCVCLSKHASCMQAQHASPRGALASSIHTLTMPCLALPSSPKHAQHAHL